MSGVDHLQHDVVARSEVQPHEPRAPRVEVDVARADGHFSAVRHRIARVHAQVHQDLLELTKSPIAILDQDQAAVFKTARNPVVRRQT